MKVSIIFILASGFVFVGCQLIPGLPTLPGLFSLPGQPVSQNLPTICLIIGDRIYVNGIDKGMATPERKQEYENYVKKLFTWPHEVFLNSLQNLLQNKGGIFPSLGVNTPSSSLSGTSNLLQIPSQPSFCRL